MNNSDEKAASRVISILISLGRQQISGSQLGELIRRELPEINIREIVGIPVGAGALSKFISLYLSGHLFRVRKVGEDWLYRIHFDEVCNVAGQMVDSIWAVFVSVDNSQVVTLDRENLELGVLDTCDVQPETQKINSVTNDELKAIQQSFIDSIDSGEIKTALTEALSAVNSYPAWMIALRKISPDYYQQWGEYRRNEIERIFLERLDEFNLGKQEKDKLAVALRKSQKAQYIRRKKYHKAKGQSNSIAADEMLPCIERHAEQHLRQSLIRIISKMPLSHLLQIKLPYGCVYEELILNNKSN